MSGKMFSSPKEEIKFWRQQAEKYKTDFEDTKEELEGFQISSRELEQELESQVEQLENTNIELNTNNIKLQNDVDSLREKLEKLQKRSFCRINKLEDKLADGTAIKDKLQKYIRELEQANDDLEETKRAILVVLENLESQLNQSVEQIALLEKELGEKTLVETVQRSKDEAKDLRQELGFKSKFQDYSNHVNAATAQDKKEVPKPVKSQASISSEVSAPSPKSGSNQTGGSGGTPLAPSKRLSLANIAGDWLLKVDAADAKLASRSAKDEPRNV